MSYEDDIAALLVRAYEIHAFVLAETGGMEGLRDPDLLHSSVSRPFVTFDGEELYASDFDKAAALLHSLIKNHPFMDGTKRTAFATTLYFLDASGYLIPDELPIDEVVDYCVTIAMENIWIASGEPITQKTIPEISAWLRALLGY